MFSTTNELLADKDSLIYSLKIQIRPPTTPVFASHVSTPSLHKENLPPEMGGDFLFEA
jgi:hypothetical protein